MKRPISLKNALHSIQKPLRIHKFSLAIIVIVSAITLYISLKSPPNNFDSMTYHMARIPNWIQNQSIRYYPTAIQRQNYSMPLAEFSILHMQLLSKTDLYANLVQWLSFMLSILTASLIAKQVQVSPRGQWITASLVAMIPMAILQSTSTQNDLVVGLFCLGFFYFLKETIRERKWTAAFFASLSLGLAMATKGTAYIFCAAIGIGLGGAGLLGKKLSEIKALAVRFAMIISIALLLNCGIYFRNWHLYRHPILTNNARTLVDKVSPAILVANLTRNGAIHLASPYQPLNSLIEQTLDVALGPQAQNPASTFQGFEFKLTFNINEDESGNGLHFLLISLCLLLYPFLPQLKTRDGTIYLLTIILLILLFSLTIKWQPWVARLQIPVFLLSCGLIGWVMDFLIRRNTLLNFCLLLILLTGTPYLLSNSNRSLLPLWENNAVFYNSPWKEKLVGFLKETTDPIPILSGRVTSVISMLTYGRSIEVTDRQELYFMGNHTEYFLYKKATQWIAAHPATTIGLLLDANDWEYPLWVLLDQHASSGPRNIYHVGVENITHTLVNPAIPQPELIIITRRNYRDLPLLADYQVIYESKTVQIYELMEP